MILLPSKPIVAIVQARMGASRLPNKMMLWLNGLPIAGWVLHRLHQAKKLDRIIFALPDSSGDDVLAAYLEGEGATVFRGDEHDVLGRFYAAATEHRAGVVVRICADNPMVTASEVDRLVEFFQANKLDYAYNHIPKNNKYPDGLGAEVTSYSALERLHHEAKISEHREHMFNYLWANTDRFRIATFDPEEQALAHPEIKLDIDTLEDYKWLLSLGICPDSSARQIIQAALATAKMKT